MLKNKRKFKTFHISYRYEEDYIYILHMYDLCMFQTEYFGKYSNYLYH